ncbi:MAG: hypothetical protein JF625_27285 [Inquilinus limosus]|uniref:Uncharacterized protein n=1 Tax=Inquilinus limosus TaxID=171674 RepID=A0A952FUX8_9PROT|nr:hypothetical protein [Inquilinus limosus]
MSLFRYSRPAGVAALLILGVAAAGPAFARTGLQSENYPVVLQTAQADQTGSETNAMTSFDHGENGDNPDHARGGFGHDGGDHGHGGGHGGHSR